MIALAFSLVLLVLFFCALGMWWLNETILASNRKLINEWRFWSETAFSTIMELSHWDEERAERIMELVSQHQALFDVTELRGLSGWWTRRKMRIPNT